MSVKSKKTLENITLYKAATTIESVKQAYHFDEKDIIKLEGNENRMGCSPKVMEALQAASREFSFYPDLNATALRRLLAQKHQMDEENFVFGNGSFELITLIGTAYIEPGDEAVSIDPSFNWYINTTLVNGGKIVSVPVDDRQQIQVEQILEAVNARTKVIWLCNPNNPTGALIPEKDLRRLAEELPDSVLLVLDEAYIDFVEDGYFDTVDLVRAHDNVILLRSFSKSYGLASFRLGYSIAGEEITQALLKVKIPCNLNYAAQVAAITALNDKEYLQKVLDNNQKSRNYYYKAFEEMGFEYVKSNTNFIFVHTGIDGTWLQKEFLKHAIMIRNGADYGYPDWLRITIGTYEENQKVVKVFQEILAQRD